MLAIDLFCGLGGWTECLLDVGYRVVGFDIEAHHYGKQRYPAQLVLQDVRSLHGSQFRNVTLIVASPPCQKYSYMSLPFTRGKELARWYRDSRHPERIVELNELFDACFRIQREASESANRHIPMVVENVVGAQPWVGKAAGHYGSYYLWGDVPTLMPIITQGGTKNSGGSWFFENRNNPARTGNSQSMQRKQASMIIAKIPPALARYIGEVYKSREE